MGLIDKLLIVNQINQINHYSD